LPKFTIGNPKYHEGLEGLGGPNGLSGPSGLDPPPTRFDGCLTKIMSTFMGISVCIFTRFVPLGVYGLDLIPVMVWVGVIVNGV
jgi:hypothetical protein